MDKILDLTSELEEQAKVIEQKRGFVDSLKPRIEALRMLKEALVADIDRSCLDKNEQQLYLNKIGDYLENPQNEIKTFSVIRSRSNSATHDDARQIFGRNFLEQSLFEEVWGKTGKVIEVGFSINELETAFTNRGNNLILVPGVSKVGEKSTNLQTLAEKMNDKKTKDSKPYLWNNQFAEGKIKNDAWFINELGIMNDCLGDSYTLHNINFIGDSTSKTVAFQKKLECLEAKATFGDQLPDDWEKEIDLYLENYDKLIIFEQSDWQEATSQLKMHKVFGIFGEGAVSTLNTCILYEKTFGIKLLNGLWNRNTNGIVSSDLRFPYTGFFVKDGMYVSRYTPNYTNSIIVVSLSCTRNCAK